MNNNDRSNSNSFLPGIQARKRKRALTNTQNKNKKQNTNGESSSATVNADDNDNDNEIEIDEEDTHKSNEPSSVWKYATRAENKGMAICSLCNKHISTSNWSTTALRRHLILIHSKNDLILSKHQQKKLTISPELKEKYHNLSVVAIVKDNLPFNAFMKSGLSTIFKEAIPGDI